MLNREFERPIDRMISEDKYGDREVGITHPDISSFIRLRDNGDVEISAGQGLQIILHRQRGTITFEADQIMFRTREQGALHWNGLTFNEKATNYTEPVFNIRERDEMTNPYRGLDNYL